MHLASCILHHATSILTSVPETNSRNAYIPSTQPRTCLQSIPSPARNSSLLLLVKWLLRSKCQPWSSRLVQKWSVTYVYIGKRASGDETDVYGEEGICVSFTLEFQGSSGVFGIDRVDRPDERVSLGSPVAFASHRRERVGTALSICDLLLESADLRDGDRDDHVTQGQVLSL
jgi:hypothetical protein